MGRISQELKELNKRFKAEERFHLIRFKAGSTVPAGWLWHAAKRAHFTADRVEAILYDTATGRRGIGERRNASYTEWYMFPGKKPDPKWGQVCP